MSNSPSYASRSNRSPNPSSGISTHGRSHRGSPYSDSPNDTTGLEHDGLIMATKPKQRGNCCTWKVATAFLFMVAIGLVVTWQLLPAEDIVAKYIPQFEEPMSPYTGPEAGIPSSDGGDIDNGGISIDDPPSQNPSDDIGVVVPSFMKCPEGDEECCNGSTDNCKLRVDEMMFGLVHNAMSSEEGGFYIGANHNLGLEKALVAGYRGLSLDVCNCGGVLQFCHNICDYGERMPNEVFTNAVQFLDDYPSEVIVLLFEASGDQGPIVWNDLYTEMTNVNGFADMIYEHKYGDNWPIMGDLVKLNKRIIVFYFNGGSCTDEECPPGFSYFFNYASETEYQSTSLDDLQNVEYSCKITRTTQPDALPANFFVVNNFVTPPDREASKVANAKTFVSDRLTKCANVNNLRPNFVYTDFWSEGVTSQLVQYANQQYAQQLGQ